MTLFNPYFWLALILMIGGTFTIGYIKGHADADRSAEVTSLEHKIALAEDVIKAKAAEASSNAEVAREFRARADDARSQIADMQEAIDDLSNREAALPAADVCRLDGDHLSRLLALARAADVRAPKSPPKP